MLRLAISQREFLAKWKGVLHQVTGVHQWVLGKGYSNKCDHHEIVRDDDAKPWMRRGFEHAAVTNLLNLGYVKNFSIISYVAETEPR